VSFLVSCSPSKPEAPAAPAKPVQPPTEEVLAQGEMIYEQLCAQCHYAGDGSDKSPALTTSATVKDSPDKMITQLLHGSRGTFKNNAGQEIEGVMPPQALSDEDIAAVVTYVRHKFGGVDALTTPADVAKLR
jgi:nitrite reductase (NO-forming)